MSSSISHERWSLCREAELDNFSGDEDEPWEDDDADWGDEYQDDMPSDGDCNDDEDAVSGDFSLITPLILSQAADEGDQVALEVWTEMGEHLGTAMGGFINLFAPDLLTVAGQIAKAGEHILTPARRTARDVAIPSLFEDVNIVQADRVEDAGILGAAALALEAIR